MSGSSAVRLSDIASTTRTGHTSRSEPRRPTRPTTASRIHSCWCCQEVGETASATLPVMAAASSSCPSFA